MTYQRMKPEARKAEVLEAALIAAEKVGFSVVRQKDIAEQAGCAYGTVSNYFSTMGKMRRAIMRAAIQRKILKIIAEGLGINDPDAKKAPEEIRKAAAKLLAL